MKLPLTSAVPKSVPDRLKISPATKVATTAAKISAATRIATAKAAAGVIAETTTGTGVVRIGAGEASIVVQ